MNTDLSTKLNIASAPLRDAYYAAAADLADWIDDLGPELNDYNNGRADAVHHLKVANSISTWDRRLEEVYRGLEAIGICTVARRAETAAAVRAYRRRWRAFAAGSNAAYDLALARRLGTGPAKP